MNYNRIYKSIKDILRSLLLTFSLLLFITEKALSVNYFQQEVNYTIHVLLNDKRNELSAYESLEYINHSKDTLRMLYFHLWPNAYLNNQTPLAKQLLNDKGKQRLFDDQQLKGYIDSLDFKINEVSINWQLLPGQPDICQLSLNNPLLPGDTIYITTPFHVKIPKGVTSRLGHIDESYQISQWYPKPAVYDQNGWHLMSYLDQGEFYSEFGNFDVSITLPSNYIVGSTGNLQNKDEIERLTQLSNDTSWKNNPEKLKTTLPPSSQELKTLRYTENNIHDFAWFADKRFHVLKGKIILPETGKEVTTWAMFTDQEADLWQYAIIYINHAISYFSKTIGEYPYNNFTAIQSELNAGVGMEYPGITVVGLAENAYSLDEVITHEIVHNWFYSAIGSNERRYPYMDEAITSSYTSRYIKQRYPDQKLWEVYFGNKKQARFLHIEDMPVDLMQELEWLLSARSNTEQPITLPAPEFTTMNYGIMLYNKASRGFEYLREYLGDSVYDLSMQDYYHNWKFKHPQPDDLRNSFEKNTSLDLSWFFNDFIETTKRLDYKIVKLKNQKLLVKNKGKLIAPVIIAGLKDDSITFEQWHEGFKGKKWIDIPQNDYSELKIDPQHMMPELFRLNNNYQLDKHFHKADPINARFLFTLDNPDKRTVIFIPVVNWNSENKFMAGVIVHNGFIIPKPFEYLIMPFYTFNDPGIAGFGRLAWNITPYNTFIRLATISLEGSKFGAPGAQDYNKIKTGFEISLKKVNLNNPYQHRIIGSYIIASDLAQINSMQKASMNNYYQFGYEFEKVKIKNPFHAKTLLELGPSYQKSNFELNYRLSYYGRNKGLDIRLFTGTMIKETLHQNFYSFAPSGRRGREMYLFEGTYPNRFALPSSSFWSKQMTLSEGGLVSSLNNHLGYSRWLISLNVASNLPGIAGSLAIKPFANILLNDHGLNIDYPDRLFWEMGLKTGSWNLFEIHIPLLVSKNIAYAIPSFKERIRFIFKLDSFNQLKLRQRLSN